MPRPCRSEGAVVALSNSMGRSPELSSARTTWPNVHGAALNSERALWPDLIRLFATVCVVLIHVSAVPAAHLQQVGRPSWDYAVIYDAVSRAAVPLFIMTSGALLLARSTAKAKAFASRRLVKVGIPLLLWSVLYFVWRIYIRKETLTFADYVYHLLHGITDPVYPHLWFLYAMLILYTLVPLLAFVLREVSPLLLLGLVLIWVIIETAELFLTKGASAYIGFDVLSLAGCVGYFVSGYALALVLPPKLPRFQVCIWVCVFVAAAAVASVGTILSSSPGGRQLDERLLAPLAPNVLVMSISAFVLLRHASNHLGLSASVTLTRLAATSFGVYLIHPMAIDVLDVIGLPLDPLPYNSIWYVPLMVGLALLISAGLAFVLRLTAWTKWTVP
jgi:surface polysaccharide O-acyltransferase-like enzyme